MSVVTHSCENCGIGITGRAYHGAGDMDTACADCCVQYLTDRLQFVRQQLAEAVARYEALRAAVDVGARSIRSLTEALDADGDGRR